MDIVIQVYKLSERLPKEEKYGLKGQITRAAISIQEALEIVETLPEYQREDLIDIIRKRMIEQNMERLAKNVREARAEYKSGRVKRGTVDDFLKELH